MRLLLLRAAHHGVAQVLGTILFLAGAGIGLSLIFASDLYYSYPMLAANFHQLSPMAWGGLFLIASLILVVTVWVDTEHAQLPAFMLGLIFIAYGLLSLLSGVSSVIYAFSALGWISIFTQIVCWAKGKHETVLYGNEPDE